MNEAYLNGIKQTELKQLMPLLKTGISREAKTMAIMRLLHAEAISLQKAYELMDECGAWDCHIKYDAEIADAAI